MNRTILAALIALSTPLVALADGSQHRLPAPPPARAGYQAPGTRDDLRDLRRVEALQARYADALSRRDRGRSVEAVEREILRAIDAEIHETRRELAQAQASRRWHEQGRPVMGERATLARLLDLRAEFVGLQGRRSWRAVERKQALVGSLVQLARRELRHDSSALAWSGRR